METAPAPHRPIAPDGRCYLTPQQVADVIGVHRLYVLRLIRAGQLRAYRLSRQTIRIDWADVQALMQEVDPATIHVDHVEAGGER